MIIFDSKLCLSYNVFLIYKKLRVQVKRDNYYDCYNDFDFKSFSF